MGCTVREPNPGGGDIFSTGPDRSWGPPSLLYSGYRVFPECKERPGRSSDHPLSSSAEVKERVELYLYSSSGPSWPFQGEFYITFTFLIYVHLLVQINNKKNVLFLFQNERPVFRQTALQCHTNRSTGKRRALTL